MDWNRIWNKRIPVDGNAWKCIPEWNIYGELNGLMCFRIETSLSKLSENLNRQNLMLSPTHRLNEDHYNF